MTKGQKIIDMLIFNIEGAGLVAETLYCFQEPESINFYYLEENWLSKRFSIEDTG